MKIVFLTGVGLLAALLPEAYAASVSSAASPDAIPLPVSPLARANNAFAWNLFRQVSPDAKQNAFLSPYSISDALAMTWAGARGDTAAQMSRILHFSDLAEGGVIPAFGELHKSLNDMQAQGDTQLTSANSLWPEQSPEHPLLPAFLDAVQKNFDSGVFPQDYVHDAAGAVGHINSWVAQKTNDKIKDIIHDGELNPATRLVLANAIYFKATWDDKFEPEYTSRDTFHLAGGGADTVSMMFKWSVYDEAYYRRVDDPDVGGSVQILSLPYKKTRGNSPSWAGLSFVVVLPCANDGLAALEKGLTPGKLNDWLATFTYTNNEIMIHLPKFALQERYDLPEALQSLGMKDAFMPGAADFSGMDGARDLFISNVIHQTFLNVDENGTEAAAATVLALVGAAREIIPKPPPITFRADHPFLFFIRDNATGSILFMGRLANPPDATAVTRAEPQKPAYVLTNLGTLGGEYSMANGINASGQVVGVSQTAGGAAEHREDNAGTHAFLYSNGKMQDLGSPSGYSVANAINDTGQIAGDYFDAAPPLERYVDFDPAEHAFLHAGGKTITFGGLGGNDSSSVAINASGQIVGWAELKRDSTNPHRPAPHHAILYQDGKIEDLGILASAESAATAINASGQIAGWLARSGYIRSAFLYSGGKMQELGTLGGESSYANAINAAGLVVGNSAMMRVGYGPGSYIEHAFLYSDGKMQDLGTLGGKNSGATAINAAGMIVGSSNANQSVTTHAFLYADGRMQDLNDLVGDSALVAAGFRVLTDATAINDRGQIAGTGEDIRGNSVAFLLTPVDGK